MSLHLTRPLVFFDLETTGTKVDKDRIVEISLLKILPSLEVSIRTFLVNPGIPIPPEASAIHGITDDKVKNEPTFAVLAKEILSIFAGSDIGGYNLIKFDLPLIKYEFARIGIIFPSIPVKIIDPYLIYLKKESRNLAGALKYYCNEELNNAHSAEADIKATKDVFFAQLQHYSDLAFNLDTVESLYSDFIPNNVDIAGKIILNEDNIPVFSFGKYKGLPVKENIDYAIWMLSSDFPEETKLKLREIISKN